jgi:hypothetical protein
MLLLVILAMPAAAQQARSARIITQFGGELTSPAAELTEASHAVLMSNGQFVVTNGKPLEVRVYDRSGRMLRKLGRSGEGPGEYRMGALLQPWSGDSVLVFSQGTRRWMLFALDGKLIREWPHEGTISPTGVTLAGSAFVRNLFGPAASCALPVLRRLAPASGQKFREAMVDPSGRIWVRDVGAIEWDVHDRTGKLISKVTLPASFLLTQFTPKGATGLSWDEDEFQHVQVTEHGLPTLPAIPSVECAPTPLPFAAERAAEVKTTMRNAMTAAEAYYADNGKYPGHINEFGRMLELPRGIDGQVLKRTDNGYALTIRDIATGWRCVVAMNAAFPGWPDGLYTCGS